MTFGEADASSMMHKIGSDEATSFEIANRTLEAGVNFFDTADVYGQDGLSERVLGTWLAKEKRRDEVVLATKCRFRMGRGPNDTGASRLHILRACEDSLRRLRTDRIDLYQIHMQDIDTPEEETLRALDDLVRAGKVLYIGCSNYIGARLTDSLWISRTQNLERFAAAQMQYSLVERGIEREVLPVCRKENVGILPWSPLAGGFLSGKYKKDAAPPAGTRLEKYKQRLAAYDTPRHWRILDAVETIARELSTTPTAVALAWLMQRPAVTSVIFGARTTAQLDDNLRAASLALPAELVKRLDEASAFEAGYPYEFIAQIQGRW